MSTIPQFATSTTTQYIEPQPIASMHVKAIFYVVGAAVVSCVALVSAVDQECAGQPKCVGVAGNLVEKLTSDCHKFPTIVAYYKCCNDNCAKNGGKKDDK